jgi:hypothetical protein
MQNTKMTVRYTNRSLEGETSCDISGSHGGMKVTVFWDVAPTFQTAWCNIPEDSHLHSWNVTTWKHEKKAGE